MDYFDMDLGLSDEDRALKEAAHKFAAEVMRPAARELDRMSAEEAVAEDSPVRPFLRRAYETEKLFRDARATRIMDGCNEVVARMGGWLLSESYPRSRTQIIHP